MYEKKKNMDTLSKCTHNGRIVTCPAVMAEYIHTVHVM